MTARRTKTPEARPTDRQILQEIEAALGEWARFYGPGVDPALQRSEGARAAARTAMTLMTHNLRLLKRCRDNCSWDPEMNMVFACLGKAEIDWGTMEYEDFRGWAGYFVRPLAFPCKRSFLDQVTRWVNEVGEVVDETPLVNDLHDLALKDFDRVVFDEIAARDTRVGIAFLAKHLPGTRGAMHADHKTVRLAVNRLCNLGLVDDVGGRNGIATTAKGRRFIALGEE